MIDPYLINLVPGGAVAIGPIPNEPPWEMPHAFGNNVLATFATNAGGTIQNQALVAPGLVGWRALIALAGAVNSRGLVNIGGTGAGAGGRTRISPIASIMSGAVTGFPATQAGHWYMETDVRMTVVTGAAPEIVFVMCPSWLVASGVIGTGNGFGLVWANTLANDNYHLIMADASGILFRDIDTGIPATDGNLRVLRVEWGWINNAPTVRALIDGIVVATITGPLTLNTANLLGMFNQHVQVGVDKMEASVANSIDAWIGNVIGLRMGRI